MSKRRPNPSKQAQTTLCKTVFAMVLGLALTVASSLASAQSAHGISVRVGVGDDYKRAELAWNSPTIWSTTLFNRSLDLNAELGLAYWRAKSHLPSRDLWQFTATPMLRYWVGERWFIEAGIGASAFSSTHFAGKDLGSNVQFADQIGVGLRLSPKQQLSLRYSHYSNAGIKRPNPGLDIFQLNYTYFF